MDEVLTVFDMLFRVLRYLVVEIVVERVVKGVGYRLCKPFKSDISFDSWTAIFTGVVFWVAVIAGLALLS